ncbi:lymphocyte antigen 75-like [Maniola hyperantus]|uniref:lymphocyte antigen 75-like n=1 Tax=Aphantopus hyperantus TaxID=2795564 RepID=UPI001568D8C2|nr:lymphocyte antigen 75-like [Maniola hyperantus]
MEKVRIFSSGTKWCIFFIITIFLVPSISSKQYRTDYVYNRKTDAFYKFHMETEHLFRAHEICDIEGASLMVPRTDEDISQAHALFKQYPDIGDRAWIGNDGNKHESAEEIPLINLDEIHATTAGYRWIGSRWVESDVIKRDGAVQRAVSHQFLPFICKVDASDAVEDKQCKVFGKGYKYFENVGSCYMIPQTASPWNEAYAECRAQGAHLIVLNSELEHQVMYNYTNEEPPVTNSVANWFFFAGIRAEKKTDGSPVVFQTIFNQTLEEAGYSQWSENEPNNSHGREYCVSLFKNDAKYNDINCADKLGFICEKEVQNKK